METGNRAPPDNLLSAQTLGTAQAQGRATSLFPSASPSPEGLLSSQREEAGRKADAAAALWPNFPLGPEGILCTLCSSPTPCLLLPGDASPGKQCPQKDTGLLQHFLRGKDDSSEIPSPPASCFIFSFSLSYSSIS